MGGFNGVKYVTRFSFNYGVSTNCFDCQQTRYDQLHNSALCIGIFYCGTKQYGQAGLSRATLAIYSVISYNFSQERHVLVFTYKLYLSFPPIVQHNKVWIGKPSHKFQILERSKQFELRYSTFYVFFIICICKIWLWHPNPFLFSNFGKIPPVVPEIFQFQQFEGWVAGQDRLCNHTFLHPLWLVFPLV